MLEDGQGRFDSVTPARTEGTFAWYRVVLREGRNREVRRLWQAIGSEVSRLLRIRYGPVQLPRELAAGSWQLLPPAGSRRTDRGGQPCHAHVGSGKTAGGAAAGRGRGSGRGDAPRVGGVAGRPRSSPRRRAARAVASAAGPGPAMSDPHPTRTLWRNARLLPCERPHAAAGCGGDDHRWRAPDLGRAGAGSARNPCAAYATRSMTWAVPGSRPG